MRPLPPAILFDLDDTILYAGWRENVLEHIAGELADDLAVDDPAALVARAARDQQTQEDERDGLGAHGGRSPCTTTGRACNSTGEPPRSGHQAPGTDGPV